MDQFFNRTVALAAFSLMMSVTASPGVARECRRSSNVNRHARYPHQAGLPFRGDHGGAAMRRNIAGVAHGRLVVVSVAAMGQRRDTCSLVTFTVLALVVAALIEPLGNRYTAPKAITDRELICSGGLAERPGSSDREYCRSYAGPMGG
jgi:hypothetical protein